MTTVGLTATLVAVVLVVVGQTTLKWGMNRVGEITMVRLRSPFRLVGDVLSVWQVWVGLAVYAVSAAAWIFALSSVPLSVAYPFLGLTYVGIAAIAMIAFDESLTPAQWTGIILVVVGVITVALSA